MSEAWQTRLKANPIPWLLEPQAHPAVRYRALTEPLDRPAGDPQVRAARAAIPTYPPIAELLAAQKRDGYWVKRDYYLPKHYGTFEPPTTRWHLAPGSEPAPPAVRRRTAGPAQRVADIGRFASHQAVAPIDGIPQDWRFCCFTTHL